MNRFIKSAVLAWAAPRVARKAQQLIAQRQRGGRTGVSSTPRLGSRTRVGR